MTILAFIIKIQAVSTTLDKKMELCNTQFQKTCTVENGDVRYDSSLKKKVSKLLKGISFSVWRFCYIDNIAYLFLSRKDIEDASKLIKLHFTHFELTVHCCDKQNDGNSKTEAMFFPYQEKQQ